MNRRRFTKTLALGLAGAAVPALTRRRPERRRWATPASRGASVPPTPRRRSPIPRPSDFRATSRSATCSRRGKQGRARPAADRGQAAAALGLLPGESHGPARLKDEVAKMVRWGQLIKKCGGSVAVVGPNNVKRQEYDFADHKANIVGRAQRGRQGARRHRHHRRAAPAHRHVRRDARRDLRRDGSRRYALHEVRSGRRPAAEGRVDPVKVVKDFLPVVRHVHMKDFDGGPHTKATVRSARARSTSPACAISSTNPATT